ncbi:protein GAMETE CELL DEFECTIVE 1, mitochondrial [Phragmites australis]|uniref:protein GAMETE CELL DEFECTIVE 1, mitochondrial n=1 Tax=Phragmites australis TaxID=29695 RepID=UPI002D7994AD|nr:protein GAMETE CELL DEFECTIVE 1, mitochondrial [Phragmites australis]
MHSLRRALRVPIPTTSASGLRGLSSHRRAPPPQAPSAITGDDEWNDAWETAWLPGDSRASTPAPAAPWESPASSASAATAVPAICTEVDLDTKAFVADMDERWAERRAASRRGPSQRAPRSAEGGAGEVAKKKAQADEYRTRKQRVHAALWVKEIEKMEEVRLGSGGGGADDIDRLLDSCSDIFDSGNTDFGNSKIPSTTEIKTKPVGWETTSRGQDGNIWEISQREEDILLQEFERRIAFSKQQIASFIKTHIFSRRRPIDGWKYMIEEIGPNARKGKGSVQRLPSVTDPTTQPYREDTHAIASGSSFRGNRP